jgi:hypothetical protein
MARKTLLVAWLARRGPLSGEPVLLAVRTEGHGSVERPMATSAVDGIQRVVVPLGPRPRRKRSWRNVRRSPASAIGCARSELATALDGAPEELEAAGHAPRSSVTSM